MFGLFNSKKRKYAHIAEKARELAHQHVQEAKAEREESRLAVVAFQERSDSDRRMGTERRRRRVAIGFPDRRRNHDRRTGLDRRMPMAVNGENNFEGRLRSRGFARDRERLLELEEFNRAIRVEDLEQE
jgi:hypothetical protein